MTGILPSTRTSAGGAYVTHARERDLGTRGGDSILDRGRILPTGVRPGD